MLIWVVVRALGNRTEGHRDNGEARARKSRPKLGALGAMLPLSSGGWATLDGLDPFPEGSM